MRLTDIQLGQFADFVRSTMRYDKAYALKATDICIEIYPDDAIRILTAIIRTIG